MPKLNISVPDPLWEQVVSASTVGSSPSAIVQDALRRVGEQSSERAWMLPPDDVGHLLAAASAQLTLQALGQFQDGYRTALERIPDLNWDQLSSFARAGFDLHAWLMPWRRGIVEHRPDPADDVQTDPAASTPLRKVDPWVSSFWKLAEDLGSSIDPIGYDRYSFTPTVTFERGYAAGLQAAYELVDRGTLPPTDH